MKITKKQLRRIIKETINEIDTDAGFDPGSIDKFESAIAYNKKEAASVMEPEAIEMYEEDAADLAMVMDMAIKDRIAGEPMGSSALRDMISRLDTAARDQIPDDFYYWIIGQEDY